MTTWGDVYYIRKSEGEDKEGLDVRGCSVDPVRSWVTVRDEKIVWLSKNENQELPNGGD